MSPLILDSTKKGFSRQQHGNTPYRDGSDIRGSTLFVFHVYDLLSCPDQAVRHTENLLIQMMITESPCRIKAAPGWSSVSRTTGYSHHTILLWDVQGAYFPHQHFVFSTPILPQSCPRCQDSPANLQRRFTAFCISSDPLSCFCFQIVIQ